MKVVQWCPTLCDPMDYTVHGILQARILEWVAFPFSKGSSQPRDQTQDSLIAGEFFTSWTIGKPKNTGVGSLSFLQRIFPTQKSNQSLLHCRWILYQLSYQGATSFCGILQWKFSCSASFKITWISYALMILCITPSLYPSPGHVGVRSFQTGHITQDCKEKNCLSEGKKKSSTSN